MLGESAGPGQAALASEPAATYLPELAGNVSTAAFVTASVLFIGLAVGAAPAYTGGGEE